MISSLSSQIQITWTNISTHRKEYTAAASAFIVISSVACKIFGKKALFILACGLYTTFYFRTSFSKTSASLISAVISLPLCGFINPLSAIPSAIYLCYYILKHQHDQQEEITRLTQITAQLKTLESNMRDSNSQHLVDTLKSNNTALEGIVLSKTDALFLLKFLEKKLSENQP